MVRIALIGAGQRGGDVYSDFISRHGEETVLTAVAEPDEVRRRIVAERHKLQPDQVFDDWRLLLEQEKMADAVIIATNDDMHFCVVEKALEKGYHVLVEKPMSNREDEIGKMEQLADAHPDQIFAVSHVLRYTPFFRTIKEVLDRGEIGELISIAHNENVGYYHMAHSYVRGNWRDGRKTSPIILAKSCHDIDILLYLTGSHCRRVSSFGSLKHFQREKMPEGAAQRCLDCTFQEECPYSAVKIYSDNIEDWPANVITREHTKEGIRKALRETDYGKCVYQLDNNVADHQVTILEFENGVCATFHLSGFTHSISRTIKLMGSRGEIRGDMEKNQVEVYHFATGAVRTIDTSAAKEGHVGHGGGDEGLMEEFVQSLERAVFGTEKEQMTSSARISAESHKVAFAAERARVEGVVVQLKSGPAEDQFRLPGRDICSV